jgi:uridine kinase
MTGLNIIQNTEAFSEALFERMKSVQEGIAELELYEFRYGLGEWIPAMGWESVTLQSMEEIEACVNRREFYDGIQVRPRLGERVILDALILRLAQMLFVGLVTGAYPPGWIRRHFYFDIRGFYFLHRTAYFTERALAHFGGEPYQRFQQKQAQFECLQDVGYKAFKEANAEVDGFFIDSVLKLIAARGTPILLAIAGPTAAGKTEVVERLRASVEQTGRSTASIELDNFLLDRDYREEQGIFSEGKAALHFELLKQALEDITRGKRISIPRYDFVCGASSHGPNGNLKAGGVPGEIEPADVIFMEGNFPFLIDEVARRTGIKVVYLTDDPIRLKRKWKRDIDYRKKYDLNYFRNRYFKEQFIMAQTAYIPQMEACDMTVDTTGAAIWVTPEIREILSRS